MEEKGTKPMLKKRMHRRLGRAFGLLGLVLLACFFAYMLRWRPQGLSLSVGDVVEENITAPYAMEDGYLTELSRQKARQQVGEVYVSGEDSLQEVRSSLEERFSQLEAFLNEAAVLWQQEAERFDGQYYYNSKSWQSMLPEQNLTDRLAEHTLKDLVSTAAGYALLEEYVPSGQRTSNQPVDITALKESFYNVLEPPWRLGVTPENADSLRQQAADALKQTSLPAAVKTELAENILKKYLTVTVQVDEAATLVAQEQAAQAVAPVLLEKGQVILTAGTVIGQGELAHLKALGLLSDGGSTIGRLVSFALYLLGVFGAYGLYLLMNCKRLLLSSRDMLTLAGTLLIGLLFSLIPGLYFSRWLPFLLVPLALGKRLEPSSLGATVVLIALVLCPLGADEGLFTGEAFILAAAGLTGGLCAGLLTGLVPGKKSLVPAAFIGGILSGLVRTLPMLYAGEEGLYILSELGCALGGAALSLVLALGLLTIGEKVIHTNEKERTHD